MLVIDAAEIAKAVAKDSSALTRFVTSINEALPNATGIVIDARSASKMADIDAYYFDVFMRQTLPAMLDANVVLGIDALPHAQRLRDADSRWCAVLLFGVCELYAARSIQGRAKTKTPPIAFIVNQHSPAFTEIFSGLQSANRAFVIQEGERGAGSQAAQCLRWNCLTTSKCECALRK